MRYTAVESSVYVSEDCYDSVNVITVSDRRVIDTSGNQKRLFVAQTLSVLTVLGAMSAEISKFVLVLLLLCTSVLSQRPESAQLGTAAGVAALCICVKSVHLVYILGRAQSSV
jgi:hypothetical protein